VTTSGSLALAQNQGGVLRFTSASAAIFFQFATPASGDIEGVTAGTGISGGGTSGTVTITNSMATEIDAKGDLIVGTGADAFARLAVGTNGHTLVADSAETTGLKWAAPAGGGKVLQVVSATYSTATTVASTTMTDTGLTATITPTLVTSKVLVLVTLQSEAIRNISNVYVKGRLMRGATTIADYTGNGNMTGVNTGGNISILVTLNNIAYLDSPATTSATTYKMQGAIADTANSGSVTFQNSSSPSSIVLLEIGA
jgi:hypothetical protein